MPSMLSMLLLLLLLLGSAEAAPLRLHVDPLLGADTDAHGLAAAEGALRTLGAARERLRRYKAAPSRSFDI
eukprot:SAG31_NODE_10301_length_1158_cov_0.968839_1_plen_71_part_00